MGANGGYADLYLLCFWGILALPTICASNRASVWYSMGRLVAGSTNGKVDFSKGWYFSKALRRSFDDVVSERWRVAF